MVYSQNKKKKKNFNNDMEICWLSNTYVASDNIRRSQKKPRMFILYLLLLVTNPYNTPYNSTNNIYI